MIADEGDEVKEGREEDEISEKAEQQRVDATVEAGDWKFKATSLAKTMQDGGWKIDTSSRYRIAATPLESRDEGDATIVIVRVAGTFPGSPANLTYRFGLAADGRIGALEVR